jgi:hypothetical protein
MPALIIDAPDALSERLVDLGDREEAVPPIAELLVPHQDPSP